MHQLHGRPAAGFESFDELLTTFVREQSVPGASLAVGRGGELCYARSIGWANVEEQLPVEPHSLFRIASISKPVTGVAILQQVEVGELKLEDRVWELLQLADPVDARWKQVTIRHLLQHTGGWDRNVSIDPMFMANEFAKEAGVPAPAGTREVIQAMLRRPLDFDPGTQYAYSNFGYCLLGRALESLPSASGKSYEQLVQENLFARVRALSPQLGRTITTAPDEVRYYVLPPETADSVFTPGVQVPLPYGTWNLEAMDSHGGWISSASDLVRFAMGCDTEDAQQGGQRTAFLQRGTIEEMFAQPTSFVRPDPDVWYGLGWSVRRTGSGSGRNTWHMGALDGTSTILVRRSDGWTWCALFNMRKNAAGEELARLIDPLLHVAADSIS